MNLPYPFTTWKEFALAAAIVVVFATAAGLFLVKFPYPIQASSNYGLGTGWSCSYTVRSTPVCIKEAPGK